MQILIVGAGPTGLTVAMELARLAIQVDIIDQRTSVSGFSRAVGILPNSTKLLGPSGVSVKIIEEGMELRSVRFLNKHREIANIPVEAETGDERSIIALAQDRTETLLSDRFTEYGGRVRYGEKLTSLTAHADHIQVGINDEEEANYDYVVAADGVRSTVRSLLGLPFPGIDLPETWSIADVDLQSWGYPNTFTIGLRENGGVFVIAPLEPKRIRIIANSPDALATVPFPLDIANIRRQGEFGISVRIMDAFRYRRIAFVGDAAHTHSPVGGRGMNLGIADAADLAQRMASGAVETYGPERRDAALYAITTSERGRKFMTGKNRVTRALARVAISALANIPPLRRSFVSNFLLE